MKQPVPSNILIGRMDLTVETITQVGLGYATHPDAFQRGREAAQIAKNQFPSENPDLVLVLGKGDVHFKDFIEGVRLVLGEETLVALPSTMAFSNETPPENNSFVVILQTKAMKFSLASEDVRQNALLRGTTALSTQFRQLRGNSYRDYPHRGVLFFDHHLTGKKILGQSLGADLGLQTWILGAAVVSDKSIPLVCRNRTISQGIIGIECLSQKPWGVGMVNIGAFPNQTDVYREAVKTALRDALIQLPSKSAAFGLVFFDLSDEAEINPAIVFEGAATVLPNVPLVGMLTSHHFVRRPHGSLSSEHKAVLAVLVPS